MQKSEILMYLLAVLWGTACHLGFLWRDFFVDRLRLELLILECELASMFMSESTRRSPLLELHFLVARLRQHAGGVYLSRLLFGLAILSWRNERTACLEAIERLPDSDLRRRGLEIYDRLNQSIA